jgi:cytochrome P450
MDQDVLQTLIAQALQSNDLVEATPQHISLRLLVLTFASTFPTIAVVWSTILDLLSSPPEAGFIRLMREEILCVKNDGGPLSSWTLEELDRLWCLDSAIKETMRLWSPLQFAATRRVRI